MNGLTAFHVAAGSLALLAGGGALAVRKGSPLHRAIGTAFFATMLAMAGSGAVMAALKPERGTAVIGILTCYLVATAWTAARRRDGSTGPFEPAATAVAAACGAAMLWFAVTGMNSSTGLVDSLPAAVHLPFAALAALAAALDLNYLLRRRPSARQRLARHLWRMCAALLIAAFSFFLGQQDEFPVAWQGSFVWFVPPLATLAAMVFWIFRMRLAAAPLRRPARAAALSPSPS